MMAEKISRFHVHHGKEMHIDLNGAYVRYSEVQALHASIIDKINLTQIAKSGMSESDLLEEVKGRLAE
jgi:hypothetical protein